MGAINDPFVFAGLSALTAAVSALWYRMAAMQSRLDVLIGQEADCQARLLMLQADLDRKHAEHVAVLARLECMKPPPDRPADGRQPP